MADPVNTGFDPYFGDPLRRFRAALAAQGINTNIISGVRSDEEQRQLVANRDATLSGRPLPYPQRGPVRVAAPVGSSVHEIGLGADVQPANPGGAAKMHALAQQFGLAMPNWGGADPYHVQLANWQQAEATQPPSMTWDQTNPANVPSQMAMNMEAGAPSSTTTINSTPAQGSSVLDTMRQNIGQYESGNDYNILGKRTNTGDQAVGRYQVMKSNIPSWTQKWLGRAMTPDEFRADPKAQDAVFNGEFGSYLQSYSPADASSKWFTGQPLAQGADKRDILGTTGARYVTATTKGINNPYAFNGANAQGATEAPGPMDPTAQAGGPGAPLGTPGSTVNPPIPTTPGTTINSTPVAGGLGGQIGQLAGNLKKALGVADDDKAQAQPDIKPDIPPAPGARNVSPLLGNPQIYAQRMAGLGQPLTWGGGPPGQMYGAGYGPQNQPVYGTSLMSQLQMLSDPTWMNQMAGG